MADQHSGEHPFDQLTPDFIIDAVESLGYLSDWRIFALNSYENRVYQVGLEEEAPLIAKFYRPGRWTNEQILEEHHFCFELSESDISIVAPLRDESGNSLFEHKGFRFSLYSRCGGRAPEFDNLDNLFHIGQVLGRLHHIGSLRPFEHRPVLDVKSFGHDSADFITEKFIPSALKVPYRSLVDDLLQLLDEIYQPHQQKLIRVHGDCHVGNLLWRDETPHFVDFDDARMAPAIQDVWMLLSGDRERRTAQLSEIVEGYNEFFDFNPSEICLIEAFRTLRMMHYAAWLAQRWHDPAFPKNFPDITGDRYWEEHILELREQFSLLQEEPLQLW